MKELDLYKFIEDNAIDLRWDEEALSCWIPSYKLVKFTELISSSLSEEGIECVLLKNGYIWVNLVPICERYDIDPNRLYAKVDNQ